MDTNKLKIFTSAVLLCVATCSAGMASADDTDVFFGNAVSDAERHPNILFVLDTSGSMGNRDGGTDSRLDRMKDAVKEMLRSNRDMNVGLMNYSSIYGGGPILYPITFLPKEVCRGFDCGSPPEPQVNTYQIDESLGDIEETRSSGAILTNGVVFELGDHPDGTSNIAGLRYTEINIARGATILDARLEFVAMSENEEPASLTIEVHDVVDTVPFTADAESISSRSFDTGLTVEWEPDEWYEDTVYQTPDVSELVQHIVGSDNWCTHNPITFKIEGTGTRIAYTYDRAIANGVDYMPKLIITQDPSTARNEDNCGEDVRGTVTKKITDGVNDAEQRMDGAAFTHGSGDLDLDHHPSSDLYHLTAGLRFDDLDIPRGVKIEDAYIKVTMEPGSSGDLDVDILVENTAKPYDYASGYGPTHEFRDYDSVSPVAWSIPNPAAGTVMDSPSLTTLVQAVINKSDWVRTDTDNGIAFLLKPTGGTGVRDLYSLNGSSSRAAELVIEYSGLGSGTGSNGIAVAADSGSSGPPVYGVSEARDEMVDIIDSLVATGGTPTVDAFYEAARYMRGEGVDYGKTRGINDRRVPREHFRISHEDSYTGGSVVRSSRCNDGNLSSRACRSEYISGSPVYISPMKGVCQANHIVLLSDGETNYNSSGPKIRTMTSATTCADSGDEACATELASWLRTTDHSSSLAEDQTITTHTIAYNLDGDGKSFLERVASAGGGNAYEADTSEQLLNVLNDLVSNVIDTDTGFTAPAATVNQFNRLTHRDDLYFAVFKPSERADWDGNIKRFRLGKDNSGGGEVVIRDINGSPAIDATTGFFNDNSHSWWPEKTDDGVTVITPDGNIVARGGAANQLSLEIDTEGVANRKVYTWVGDSATSIATPIDLTAAPQKLHEDNALITDAILDIVGKRSNTAEQEDYRESLLQWARGVDVLDDDGDDSTTDIRRSMGDPMHSRPVIVNYASTATDVDVRSMIFVGTNEGYLHAIDTETGKEEFAYVPYELLANLNTFAENQTMFDRPYGLDGQISVWREDNNDNQLVDNGEKAMLFVGMRRGGHSYYALDISNPDQPKLAWTIKQGMTGFETLGQTWSRMTPVKMFINGQPEDVLVFGGGYDENQDYDPDAFIQSHSKDDYGAGLYIVRATTGQLLWSGLGIAGGSKFFGDMEYGFNGHIRTIDINRDGFVDQMYAADAGGQLWRFDMTQYHESAGDELVDGGVIADFSGFLERDHRRFYNEPDVALIEGGGEQFLSVSIGSGWRANPLDETTEDRFYMVRQYAVYDKPEGYGKRLGISSYYTPLSEFDLINVTSTATPDTNKYGWYLELENPGEKVLGTSVTFDNKVIFSSYLPSTQLSECTAEAGSGRAYVLDVASGAPTINLDSDSDTDTTASNLTLSDRSQELNRSGIPPEAMVLITEDAPNEPKILIGGEQLDADIRNNTLRTFWSDEGESGEIVVTETED